MIASVQAATFRKFADLIRDSSRGLWACFEETFADCPDEDRGKAMHDCFGVAIKERPHEVESCQRAIRSRDGGRWTVLELLFIIEWLAQSDRLKQILTRLVVWFHLSAEDAEDSLQWVCGVLIPNMVTRYDPAKGDLMSYVYASVRNELSQLRRKCDLQEELDDNQPDGCSSPEIERINALDLQKWLGRLLPWPRKLVYEHYIVGYSEAELAKKYDKTEAAIRQALWRAVESLRRDGPARLSEVGPPDEE